MRLVIRDIQHTGNSGKRGVSKVGSKYDMRRNKEFEFDPERENKGWSLYLRLRDYIYPGIYTTPYIDSYFDDNCNYIIETQNSLYVCEVIDYEV